VEHFPNSTGYVSTVAWNSVGQYEFKTEQALVQAADMLDQIQFYSGSPTQGGLVDVL